MTQPSPASVFASAVVAYRRAGWPAILPVPPETKFPPPVGFTGEHGADTTPEQLAQWATNGFADHSVALRMPDGVIGIDVDHYAKGDKQKVGADTLAELITRWGELPATWCSTARGGADGPGPSRIMLFRVPTGRYRTKFADIEIIQRHHRYAVVAPSPHAEVGQAYRWYRPDGSQAAEGEVPGPADLPELPEAWVAGLREGAAEAGPLSADVGSGASLLAQLQADHRPACSEMTDAALSAERALRSADSGSRHDTMIGPVYRVVMLGAGGHPGTGAVLAFLSAVWEELTAGENRGDEYERIMLTAARKAVTKVGASPVPSDPCLMFGGFEVPAPAPADDRGDGEGRALPGPIAEPMAYSWRHVVGTELFDPQADLDQTLAREILMRTWPMMRHASDSGGWLQRGPVQWELHKDLTRRAVSEVAELMPRGDPGPPDKPPTPEQRQAARRKRLLTNASANAVATSMKALVTGGFHPNAVKLADLDADPEILWAGGMAYDLRACAEGPAFAQADTNTPHLRSAGVRPELVDTPTWDRFVIAVWPDTEIRAWALRVLSIALTGHPDAALPILMGDGGTGKTSTIELLMSLLGSYAHAADPRLLGDHTGHASIVFALKGRRLSFIDEGPREGRWAQERLKQLTGGGRLTANEMNQNPITFTPTHTLVLTANTEPVMTDEAVRRRARIIPCTGDPAVVRAARSALTPAVWRTEAPGVLAMFMREAAAWLAEPDSALTAAAPVSIRGIADELATEQDPIGRWVEDMCEPWETGTKASDLYRAFVGWCRDMNIRAVPNLTVWGKRLNQKGFPALERRDGRYRALRVRPGGGGFEQMFPTSGPGGGFGDPGGGFVEGLTPNPPQSENPTSTPVFSTSVEGVEGLLQTLTDEKERGVSIQNAKYTSDRRLGSNPPQVSGKTEPELREPPLANPPHEPSTSDLEPRTGEPGLNVDSPSPKPNQPTNAEVAARAYQGGDEKKISKAEARAQLKEEARLAAILEAQGGEPVALPVGVGRSGAITPMSIEDAETMIRWAVTRDGALTVDVETTGYPIGHADYGLRTVQLGAADIAIVFDPLRHADVIRTLLAEAPKLHAFSATADLVPLADAGLIDAESAWDRMYDLILPAKLTDPGITGTADGLKATASAVLGSDAVATPAEEARKAVFKTGRWRESVKVDTPIERSGWAQIDPGSPVMLRYAASDVLDTAALARALPGIPDAVLGRERLAQRLTARVTHRGVRLDYDHVREMTRVHTAARAEFDVKVRELLGVENPGSDTQIAKALQAKGAPLKISAKGNPSAAKDELQKLARTEFAEVAQAVLDFRHHDTVLGTFLHPYATLCERGDGRARPTIYTLGTDTGRMSAVRPNIQQLPREGGTRACIVADPGQLMIGADFSGVEIRVAAALSQDPTLLTLIAEGRDLHAEVARQVWGESAGKAERYIAKRIVFGRIYGGGVPTLAAQAGVSESIVQSVIDNLDALTPQLTAWSAHIRQMVKQGHTQFPSYSGRIIHFPREYPHKAPNYAIQGSAREILIDALERWNRTRWANATILPVHDELDAFVPAEEAEEATAALIECMTTELYGVKIVAEPSAPSPFWADSV
jgi:P4 family phage/plasmid primase-like protien